MVQNIDDAVIKPLARLRDGDLPRRPLQEPYAELVLQPPDPFGHDRWRHAQRAGGERHAACRNDFRECLQFIEIKHFFVPKRQKTFFFYVSNAIRPSRASLV
jgi:hypothetical protein